MADVAGVKQHRLPAWPRFEKLIGGDRAARTMYIAMLRAEADLLSASERKPRLAGATFQRRCQQLEQAVQRDGAVSTGSLAALLFVAADPQVPPPSDMESKLYRFCSRGEATRQIASEGGDPVLRHLVGNWISAGRGGYYTLRLAMTHDFPEGLIAARKILGGQGPSYYKQYAALAMAKLGGESDLPFLEKLLTDTQVCATHRINNGPTYETQVRDAALVALLHLRGRDPKEFGFDRLQANSQYVYSPYSIGFAEAEEREKAFAKWEAFNKSDQP